MRILEDPSFPAYEEEKHLQSGDKLGLLNVSGTDAGMMICYDIRFPELARKLAINGAKMLFVPAAMAKSKASSLAHFAYGQSH